MLLYAMFDDLFQILQSISSYSVPLLVTLAVSSLLRALVFAPTTPTKEIPLARHASLNILSWLVPQFDWLQNGFKHIHDAFNRNPNEILRLPSRDRTQIVLPPRFLDEIKDLPRSVMDVGKATSDFFVGNWTTMDVDIFGHATVDAVSAQYISRMNHQVAPSLNEASFAFSQAFSECKDWTTVTLPSTILPLVAQTVARTVVGPELCRERDWIYSVIEYSQNVFMSAVYLKLGPQILRPLISMLMPQTYRIRQHRRRIHQLASPLVKQALQTKGAEGVYHKLKTSVDWLVEVSPEGEATPEMIIHRLTGISFGATHTTSAHIMNCILDLANDFDTYAGPLREEIDTVLDADGTQITNAHLSKMWKLDSFMKESQRFHPISALSVNRTVVQPYRLSSGTVLPQGAHISFAGGPMSQSDEYFKNAKSFDGFRFERMRRNPSQDHHGLQFTSTYEGTLHFGHGRQTCPGRFLGSAISKIVLIKLLQRYDFRLAPGQSRPEDMTFMDMVVPHPECQVMFKDRDS
ncbi:putative cytochrome P450 [Karstenula rhodostoma CBS 690.94]|uniref:Cytochrome P450 n=1 Tax=Karstenula rhodostoma CBS 690.94 TaxID=1392251 RepID=A0A9P4PXM0_9PLEO|nr:putative cytochrome P450 [Karstenula rhodostoma CBS 690.94]